MKILYLYNEEWEKEYFSKKLEGRDIVFSRSLGETPEEIKNSAEIISVFVCHPLKKEELDSLPALKLISTRSTGFDHIEKEEASSRGIPVSYVPTYGENTVAEFTFALLLTLSRKIYDAYNRITESGSFSQNGLRGFDLKGKTIGIIGTGHIGLNSAKIAKGFGMEVIAYDPFPNEKLAKEIGFRYTPFDELLSLSDVITLHAPHNDSTHHMINKTNIDKIKNGAYLINTARGALVETSALVEALGRGIIAGAGLDVLEEEGYQADEMKLLSEPHPNLEELKITLSNHYLIDHPRVIITPHNAFNTTEAISRILDVTIDNISSFLSGSVKNQIPTD